MTPPSPNLERCAVCGHRMASHTTVNGMPGGCATTRCRCWQYVRPQVQLLEIQPYCNHTLARTYSDESPVCLVCGAPISEGDGSGSTHSGEL